MISSVAPTRLSTFYTYLITKIGNRNLNSSSQTIRKVINSENWLNQHVTRNKKEQKYCEHVFFFAKCPEDLGRINSTFYWSFQTALHLMSKLKQAAKCRIYSEYDWLQETIGTVGIVLVISYPASLALFHVGRAGRYSGMN